MKFQRFIRLTCLKLTSFKLIFYLNRLFREKSKVLEHFKEIMKDTSSPDASKLLKQVELQSTRRSYIPSTTSLRQNMFSTSIYDMRTSYLDVMDQDQQDETDVEAEEARIRELRKQLTDMMIRSLKHTKVDVDKVTERELHTPPNQTALPANLQRRLKLLTSSSPTMAKKRLSLLSAKPVASIPHSLKIDAYNVDTMASGFSEQIEHLEAANDYCTESESSEDSIYPSEKSSQFSRKSSAKSTTWKKLVHHSEPTVKPIKRVKKRRQTSLPKIWRI